MQQEPEPMPVEEDLVKLVIEEVKSLSGMAERGVSLKVFIQYCQFAKRLTTGHFLWEHMPIIVGNKADWKNPNHPNHHAYLRAKRICENRNLNCAWAFFAALLQYDLARCGNSWPRYVRTASAPGCLRVTLPSAWVVRTSVE